MCSGGVARSSMAAFRAADRGFKPCCIYAWESPARSTIINNKYGTLL
ncbi:protein of unknown function [Candidatus Nitrosocaldus cavascurensis]|uniref:Uncharacterized protein n=1 Tax=Candidatus Nitrosocaldus cavascurensis TaxID=2058097 RepID=A0A2K5APB3_9ARCH|nr:protein of unknown function [Candidatus Nitrosocaldus cavascurensis]